MLIDPSGERSFVHHVGGCAAIDLGFIRDRLDLFAACRFALIGYIGLLPGLEADLAEAVRLIAETGARGWDAVPIERREGIGDPEPAAQAYREILRSSFHAHAAHGSAQGETENNADDSDNKAFEYFVQAQLVWDRAFAEGLASASAAHPDALVVGIIGSGHLRYFSLQSCLYKICY